MNDNERLLFCYGTLMPAGAAQAGREGFVPDAVRGRLYDPGYYPMLVDAHDAAAPWVEGYTRWVPVEALNGILDDYEGVAFSLYRRETVTTRAGLRAEVYVYAREIPAGTPGPFTRWDGKRRVSLLDLIQGREPIQEEVR
jgi:gamma-glutamylcyclotransferase (GGCT)/AIG2-like uncharacterized protein YtfP